ncbi:5-deoxy-glucuronate isomerase [Nocardioides bruguierae]|uniref:5-deoxy-glucuronate isomerase n=1 Tax=Nocardioides bruguierae TaxID=2945102 RepID=A0A9X2D7J4_9ACTN|nr:5-deoxy-glucuronate isomerase [Nocardioides bruguierae]MCM0620848.1 5-deoxy-glucuronate isomerase [Nocardioides bruguierae]
MSAGNDAWVLPLGAAAADGCDVVVDDRVEGWAHTGLKVVTLGEGGQHTLEAEGWELVVVPLSGGSVGVVSTSAAGEKSEATLVGRPSVFASSTDVAYVPAGSTLELSAAGQTGDETVRVAVCAARTKTAAATERPFVHLPAANVPVEMRGAGICSREVRNFGIPGVLEAESIIACEVLTPAGNWSSYPPHKHDEHRPGEETVLEEIYYFETQVEGEAAGTAIRGDKDPIGYQRVYGTDERPIDVLAEVRTGDVVLVPHGWHGPAMAAPGYDLYYLNVMAGPGEERSWLICDDPSHGWVRETWGDQPLDPRLPFGGK